MYSGRSSRSGSAQLDNMLLRSGSLIRHSMLLDRRTLVGRLMVKGEMRMRGYAHCVLCGLPRMLLRRLLLVMGHGNSLAVRVQRREQLRLLLQTLLFEQLVCKKINRTRERE